MKNNVNDIVITEKEIELLKKIKYERQTQDKKMTNLPIYIVEDRDKIAIHPCHFFYDSLEVMIEKLESLFSLEDIKNGILRNTELPANIVKELESKNEIEEVEKCLKDYGYEAELFKCNFIHKTIAIFLSLKDAAEYMKYQKHNLCNPRILVKNIGYGNEGLLSQLLQELDKK